MNTRRFLMGFAVVLSLAGFSPAAAFAADPALSTFEGHVSDSGEGRWTVHAAILRDFPASSDR